MFLKVIKNQVFNRKKNVKNVFESNKKSSFQPKKKTLKMFLKVIKINSGWWCQWKEDQEDQENPEKQEN